MVHPTYQLRNRNINRLQSQMHRNDMSQGFSTVMTAFPVGPSRHGMPATTLAMVAIQHGDPTHCGCRSWGVADDFVTWGDIKWDHPTDKTCIVEATNQ